MASARGLQPWAFFTFTGALWARSRRAHSAANKQTHKHHNWSNIIKLLLDELFFFSNLSQSPVSMVFILGHWILISVVNDDNSILGQVTRRLLTRRAFDMGPATTMRLLDYVTHCSLQRSDRMISTVGQEFIPEEIHMEDLLEESWRTCWLCYVNGKKHGW